MHKAVHWGEKTPALANIVVPSRITISSSSPLLFLHILINQPGHSIDHLLSTPLELIYNKRDCVRKAREAHLINKAMTLEPLGINRRDEQN